jgi:hypothetical protein
LGVFGGSYHNLKTQVQLRMTQVEGTPLLVRNPAFDGKMVSRENGVGPGKWCRKMVSAENGVSSIFRSRKMVSVLFSGPGPVGK